MTEREQRKNELLIELSRRFRDNAETMRKIATRIQAAAHRSQHLDQQVQNTDERLQAALDGKTGVLPFSYLEYIEFGSAQEFAKFRQMPTVSDEDLIDLNMEELCQKLQEYERQD